MQNLSKEKFFFFSEDCSEIKIVPNSIEHAYFAVLKKDLVSAKEIFNHHDNPRANWGVIFVSVLEGYMEKLPTYFQIRNFFEIDLDFLIKNGLIDYVENLLGAIEYFVERNQECYKFAARVMYENKFLSSALKYMEKSKDIFYSDAELHFMFAKYYLNVHNYLEAQHYIKECLKIIPDYYPAICMKQKIEEYIH